MRAFYMVMGLFFLAFAVYAAFFSGLSSRYEPVMLNLVMSQLMFVRMDQQKS